MESERRGLLILFEGFPPTVIRSQVIALVTWLARERLIHFDILSVACSQQVFEQGRGELDAITETVRRADPDARVTLLRGMRPVLPGATAYNRSLVRGQLRGQRQRYRLLHARTDYAACIVGPLGRALKIPVIWDCRGDAVAEFLGRSEHARMPRMFTRWRAKALLGQTHRAARVCSAAIFVSSALCERWRAVVTGPSHVIPTLADGDRFHFDPQLRARTRQELGFSDGQAVFVFSGTLSPYQGFADAVTVFQRVLERAPDARLLLLTPSVAQGEASLAMLAPEQFIARAVQFQDMNRMLNAADFAFLTRPSSPINRAAFPTKFAEYGLAGLPVIMSDATPDCVVHAQRAGNYLPVNTPPPLQVTDGAGRATIAAYYRSALTLESFRARYESIYAGSRIEHAAPS